MTQQQSHNDYKTAAYHAKQEENHLKKIENENISIYNQS